MGNISAILHCKMGKRNLGRYTATFQASGMYKRIEYLAKIDYKSKLQGDGILFYKQGMDDLIVVVIDHSYKTIDVHYTIACEDFYKDSLVNIVERVMEGTELGDEITHIIISLRYRMVLFKSESPVTMKAPVYSFNVYSSINSFSFLPPNLSDSTLVFDKNSGVLYSINAGNAEDRFMLYVMQLSKQYCSKSGFITNITTTFGDRLFLAICAKLAGADPGIVLNQATTTFHLYPNKDIKQVPEGSTGEMDALIAEVYNETDCGDVSENNSKILSVEDIIKEGIPKNVVYAFVSTDIKLDIISYGEITREGKLVLYLNGTEQPNDLIDLMAILETDGKLSIDNVELVPTSNWI